MDNNCLFKCEGTVTLNKGEEIKPRHSQSDTMSYYSTVDYDEYKKTVDELQIANGNVERFQALYTTAIAYILRAIKENNTNVLSDAVKELSEIELKYIKK